MQSSTAYFTTSLKEFEFFHFVQGIKNFLVRSIKYKPQPVYFQIKILVKTWLFERTWKFIRSTQIDLGILRALKELPVRFLLIKI